MASFRHTDSTAPLQQQQQQQQQQQHIQHQEMIDIQSSKRHSSTGKNKMVVTTLDGEEEEIEVIGSGISSSFQPASERRPRLPLKLPNLKYNAPESSANNYSPGTSLVFNAYGGHGRLLTQPYAVSGDNDGELPPEHTYQRLPGAQSQDWSQDPYSQHRHSQPPPPSRPYDSDGYPSYHPQHHYPDYPSYRTPHDRPYPPYPSNSHDPRDPRDSRDSRDPPIDPRDYRDPHDFRDPHEARERYERDFDSPHSNTGPPSPRRGSSSFAVDPSSRLDDPESRGRMDHFPPPHPRDSRVSQPPSMSYRLRSPHNALDPPHPKSAHSPYDDPANGRYHPFPSQQRPPADPWDSLSEHRPPYPSAAIDIPQPPHRRSVNTPADYRRHEAHDNTRSQHRPSYPHMPQQSPSRSAAGPSSYRDPFNSPRGEGPRYEFSRINYRMIFEYASEIRDCLIKGKVGTTDRLLYNAEILSKIFMGCRVDQEPIDHVEEELALNPHQLRCTSCNIVKTPEWRKGPLGPRTLCNACGLIWGKLSRSKAALAAKNKQEADTKTETEKPSMVDLQPTTNAGAETPKRPAIDPITLTDIARKKRGRGRSTTRDEGDDMGSGTMLNDNETLGSVSKQNGVSSYLSHDDGNRQAGTQGQTEDVNMSGGDSPPPPPQPSFRSSAVEPDTVQEGGCQIDPLQTAVGPVPPPQSPDTLPFSAHENHDKEGPVTGRKLNLSYLLA